MEGADFKDNGLLKWDEPQEKNFASKDKNLNLQITSSKNSAKKLPPMEGKAQVEDILKFIFPPREFNVNGKEYFMNMNTPVVPLLAYIIYNKQAFFLIFMS